MGSTDLFAHGDRGEWVDRGTRHQGPSQVLVPWYRGATCHLVPRSLARHGSTTGLIPGRLVHQDIGVPMPDRSRGERMTLEPWYPADKTWAVVAAPLESRSFESPSSMVPSSAIDPGSQGCCRIGGPAPWAPRHQGTQGSEAHGYQSPRGGKQPAGMSRHGPSRPGCIKRLHDLDRSIPGGSIHLARPGPGCALVPISPGALEPSRIRHIAGRRGTIPTGRRSPGNLVYWYQGSSNDAARPRVRSPAPQ